MALQAHFVLTCKANWTKIVSIRPVTITLLVSNVASLVEKMKSELKRCLGQVNSKLVAIRIIAIGPSPPVAPNSAIELEAVRNVWHQLVSAEPTKCVVQGLVYEAIPPPSLLVIDGLQRPWLHVVRSLPQCPPVLQWMAGFSGGFVRIVGPKHIGGRGDYLRRVSTGDLDSIKDGATSCDGELARIPGMPTMYDWEYFPQDLGAQGQKILAAEIMLASIIDEVDGLATCCSYDYDGINCLDSISQWIGKINNRPTFHIGSMLPFKPGTADYLQSTLDAELAMAPDGIGAIVSSFLDNTLARSGKHSLVYISFGTEHWPSSTDHLRALLHALQARKIPFVSYPEHNLTGEDQILAHAYPHAVIPEDILENFRGDERALFIKFAPQQAILAHAACGWFLTHGGSNGTIEAVSQGVPMLGWPFAIDHPPNIAHCVHQLDVAFEFIEVRTGEQGLKPIYATGKTPKGTVEAFKAELEQVLDDVQGEAGLRKRRNAMEIRERLAQTWAENGKSTKVLAQLVDYYTSG